MMNVNDYLNTTATITLTMDELHTIHSALQVAFYANRDKAEELEAKGISSHYYAGKAEKCWDLFGKADAWFPEYIDEKDRW